MSNKEKVKNYVLSKQKGHQFPKARDISKKIGVNITDVAYMFEELKEEGVLRKEGIKHTTKFFFNEQYTDPETVKNMKLIVNKAFNICKHGVSHA